MQLTCARQGYSSSLLGLKGPEDQTRRSKCLPYTKMAKKLDYSFWKSATLLCQSLSCLCSCQSQVQLPFLHHSHPLLLCFSPPIPSFSHSVPFSDAHNISHLGCLANLLSKLTGLLSPSVTNKSLMQHVTMQQHGVSCIHISRSAVLSAHIHHILEIILHHD